MRIRPAVPADLPRLQDIERAAGEPFRAVGMAAIADDEPPPLDLLDRYRLAGRAWVGDDDAGRPVAYLIHDDIDGAAHIEQVSVHPLAARRGLGRALIEHLAGRAASAGLAGLTLTTFADVPWNAPYYTRLGFRTLMESELTDGLREIRRAEAAHGLDHWPRVCMSRTTEPAPRPAVPH
ncbi:GNAT family N-acetyltransferase [Streptomyces sp. NBC_01498]|uniref:GNAT family N-acetyltransferase n=1 Tax=Streptomyces sp. NBC_01498 TaxID=2975870 RepID=UPI002E7B4C61|nr:GNAT family N-acetyltransferase [Streptomyces sp. NBC_01498]WTL23853.1 GNAT family N-acetyltransferase [Streptomyces sp. NBC_01498]